MEKQEVSSLKSFVGAIELNLSKLREAMKAGDDEEFKRIKIETIEISDKISRLGGARSK